MAHPQPNREPASDLALARVLLVVAFVVIVCYYAVRLLGRSRLAVVVLLLVAGALVAAGRSLWRSRRASLEAEARQRETEFWRTTIPTPAVDLPRELLSGDARDDAKHTASRPRDADHS